MLTKGGAGAASCSSASFLVHHSVALAPHAFDIFAHNEFPQGEDGQMRGGASHMPGTIMHTALLVQVLVSQQQTSGSGHPPTTPAHQQTGEVAPSKSAH
jgi:hypothetical protein